MKYIYSTCLLLISILSADAQYISRSQPVPFSCPTVCPGSVIVLDVPQVQNLNTGDAVQVWLSDATGSFSSGTTTITPTAYSLNTGSTWTSGAYYFSSNINDLYLKITIPTGLPAGTGYTIKMKTSSGFIANDPFSCSGSNYITVTSAYPTTGNIAINAEGNDQWIGNVFTWTATTPSLLTTTALVSAQDFFNTNNYKGYFLKDSLSFDINYNSASGGTCPGQPGVLNDGTNIPCSQGFAQDFSIRLLRKQHFSAGSYRFTIQGDDGIRLSIDSGRTWLLSSYFEQLYANSFRTTDSLYPNGICLSGPTDLMIEFFQRNVDSRLTFTATQLSAYAVGNAGNQSTCSGGTVNFNLAGSSPSLSYQWYYSSDSGRSFNIVPNSGAFSGANTSNLGVGPVPGSYNNYLFYCSVSGLCSNAINTATDTLLVFGQNNKLIYITTNKKSICPHNDTATICVSVINNNETYLWNTGATTPCITTDTAGDFYASVTLNGACSDNTNHIHISIYPPVSPVIQQHGDTLSVNSGSHFEWFGVRGVSTGDTSSTLIATHSGSYYVTLIDSNGCPEQSTAVNMTTTGLVETSYQAAITIYPNPVTDICHIVIGDPSLNGSTVQVYDELGQIVIGPILLFNTAAIDMHGLSGGVYIVKTGNTVKKIVKE